MADFNDDGDAGKDFSDIPDYDFDIESGDEEYGFDGFDAGSDDGLFLIGVVGEMTDSFDVDEVTQALNNLFDEIEDDNPDVTEFGVAANLIDAGVPTVAYDVAKSRGWETWGVAPVAAKDHDWYDVDRVVIVGKDFGDESQDFIDGIDALVRIGGDDQTSDEVDMATDADIPVYEYELDDGDFVATDTPDIVVDDDPFAEDDMSIDNIGMDDSVGSPPIQR